MKARSYYTKRALEIINSINYITIATVTPDGKPWNSPVYFVHDKLLNIYWFSDKENQHSINVRKSGTAFGVIYDSTVPEGDGEGVYLQFDISAVVDEHDISVVRRLKKGDDYQEDPNAFLGQSVRRVYKAVPNKIWMNDAEIKNGAFIRDYKVELDLNKVIVA